MRLKEQQFEINGYHITVEYDNRGQIDHLFIQQRTGEVLFEGSTEFASELQETLSRILVELVSPNVEAK